MISQMNRAAVSVMLNIAEGSARRTLAERKRFYEISRSSAIEIDSLFEGECRIEFFDGSCV
jgi:four helix bundle protein